MANEWVHRIVDEATDAIDAALGRNRITMWVRNGVVWQAANE